LNRYTEKMPKRLRFNEKMKSMKAMAIMAFWFVLFSAVFGGSRPPVILMPPYLQAVTTDSIWILIESSTVEPLRVEYGPDLSYGQSAATTAVRLTNGFSFVHHIKLSHLLADTLYHFRVVTGNIKLSDFTFHTAVPAGVPFRFGWMADTRLGQPVHDQIAKRMAAAQPLLLLYGGDLSGSSRYDSYKNDFFRPDQLALISRVPFFNAPGNHERWDQNTKAFTQAPESSSGTQDFYSFDCGDLHVLVLNTQLDHDRNSSQYAFASKDLSASKQAWKIVIAHKPAYSAGGHGGDGDLQIMTGDVFEKNGVAVFIAGHNHFYQHDLVKGIHHLTIGSAGAPLYNTGHGAYTIKSVKDYNYAVADVTPDTLKMVVYNAAGKVLDTIELKK
jgi:predicted phosphodiesterase